MATPPSFPNDDCPRFTGYLDVTTDRAIRKLLHPHKYWATSMIVLLPFLIPFALVLLCRTVPALRGTIVAVVTLLILCVTSGIVCLSYWIGTHWEHHRRKTYQATIAMKPRTGWVYTGGIHIQSAGEQNDLEWSHFSDRLELNDAIGLVKEKSLIDGFSSAMFASPAEWQKAKQMIQNGIKRVPKK